jgi:hypothetical protein
MLALPEIAAQKAIISSDQVATRLPVELILSPENITVAPHSDLQLTIRWINHSNKTLFCDYSMFTSGISEGYIYDIQTLDGKPVQRVPAREKEKAIPVPASLGGYCEIKPGDAADRLLLGLMRAFEMNRPGEYAVQVSVPDPDHPNQILGRSNVVTITVKAPRE